MRSDSGTEEPGGSSGGWRALFDPLYARLELFEKYDSPEWVNEGGYGRVGKITDQHLRRGVSVKTPKLERKPPRVTEKDEDTLARFVFEAFVMASLPHPAVPPIHEIGIDRAGLPYYTTKWIRGKTLKEVIDDYHAGVGGWTTARLVSALIRICETMEYAHSRGVLHRDLTHYNVMMGRFGEMFVLDWGLAKLWDPEAFEDKTGVASSEFAGVLSPPPSPESEKDLSPHTGQSRIMGTPFFIAPELLSMGSDKATPQADVYALGVILYFLLCRRLPYETEEGKPTKSEYLRALQAGPPVPPREINAASGDLAAVCEQALAHDPSERLADMAGLRMALRNVLRSEEGGIAAKLKLLARRLASRRSSVGNQKEPDGREAPRGEAHDFFDREDLLTMVNARSEAAAHEGHRRDTGATEDFEEELTSRLKRLEERTLIYFDYELLGEIARGGMGVVMKAFDPRLRRVFALKTVVEPSDRTAWEEVTPSSWSPRDQPHRGPSADQLAEFFGPAPTPESQRLRNAGRLLAEAQITAQLDHPNIVSVHDVGVYPRGCVYYTMELIQGKDLRGLLGEPAFTEKLSLTGLLEIMLQVCEAAAYAHRKGVVHRDVKPSNVIVGKFGEVYLIDWGLGHILSPTARLTDEASDHSGDILTDLNDLEEAHAADATLSARGDVIGTPAYMSPEQMRGDISSLSGKSDVYSLGSTFFHLLTGRMPFLSDGMTPVNLFRMRLENESRTESVRARNPSVPAAVAHLCEWTMSPSPSDRPTAKQMALELRRLLDQPPRSAHRWRVQASS